MRRILFITWLAMVGWVAHGATINYTESFELGDVAQETAEQASSGWPVDIDGIGVYTNIYECGDFYYGVLVSDGMAKMWCRPTKGNTMIFFDTGAALDTANGSNVQVEFSARGDSGRTFSGEYVVALYNGMPQVTADGDWFTAAGALATTTVSVNSSDYNTNSICPVSILFPGLSDTSGHLYLAITANASVDANLFGAVDDISVTQNASSVPIVVSDLSPGGSDVLPLPTLSAVITDGDLTVETDWISLVLNGVPVSAGVNSDAGTHMVSYTVDTPLSAGSSNVVDLIYYDSAYTAATSSWSFVVVDYTTLSVDGAVALSETNNATSGFWSRDVSWAAGNTSYDPLQIDSAEEAFSALRYEGAFDAATDNSVVETNLSYSMLVPYALRDVVNMGSGGLFGFDESLPANGNYGEEVFCYLQLDAGIHTIGINGYRSSAALWIGNQALDFFTTPDSADLSAGDGQSEITFAVAEAGLYPVRVVHSRFRNWSHYFELYSVEDGVEVLLNDTANGGLAAWRVTGNAGAAFTKTISPMPSSYIALSEDVSVELGGNLGETLTFSLNGTELFDGVDYNSLYDDEFNLVGVEIVNDDVLIPAQSNTFELVYSDAGTGASCTNLWSYEVGNYVTFLSGMPTTNAAPTSPMIEALLLNEVGTLNTDTAQLLLNGEAVEAVVTAGTTNFISYQATDLAPGSYVAEVVYEANEGGGLVTNSWSFGVDEYVQLISTTPEAGALGITDSPLISATFVNLNGSLVYASLLLDGAEVGFESGSGVTNTISYQAEGLGYQNAHEAMVVYEVTENPGVLITNCWSFTVADPTRTLWNINLDDTTSADVVDGTVILAPSTASNYWNNLNLVDRYPAVLETPLSITNASGSGDRVIGLNWTDGIQFYHKSTSWGVGTVSDALWAGYAAGKDTLELSGLDTNAAYDVYVYYTMGWSTTDGETNAVTITEGVGDDLSETMVTVQANCVSGNYAGIVDGENYVVFSAVTPSLFGNIDISATKGFSALQIVEHPGAANPGDIAYVSTTPEGATELADIEVVMLDWAYTLDAGDVTLLLDGSPVTPDSVSKNSSTTTVSYAAMLDDGTYTVGVVPYTGAATNEWTFTLTNPITEGPVVSATFSGDSLIMSWEGGSYSVLTNANLLNTNGWGIAISGASSPVTNAISSEASLFYKLESN